MATFPATVMEGKSAVRAMWAASGSMMKLRSDPMSWVRGDWRRKRLRSTMPPITTSSLAVRAKESLRRIAVAMLVNAP